MIFQSETDWDRHIESDLTKRDDVELRFASLRLPRTDNHVGLNGCDARRGGELDPNSYLAYWSLTHSGVSTVTWIELCPICSFT